jgi:hypothetical protein
MGSVAVGLTLTAILALSPAAALAVDELMDGKLVLVQGVNHFREKSVRFHTGDGKSFALPDASNDPRDIGGTLTVFDTGGGAGTSTFDLPDSGWKKIPPGNPNKVEGFQYKGEGTADDPCKYVIVRPQLVKAFCKGEEVTLTPPFSGDVAIVLTIGSFRYCALFGGSTVKNNENRTTRMGSVAPSSCPDGGGGTTSTSAPEPSTTSTSSPEPSTTSTSTPEGSTTSTSAPEGSTTSTSTPEGSTTSTSTPGGSSTSTSTPEGSTTSTSTPEGSTTSTSAPEGSTTSTSTPESSTTTTSVGGGLCCNGQSFVSFSTVTASGDCGDIINATGVVVANVDCAGLYTGGGGNSVPLPFAVPDLGLAISAITECTGQNATLGSTTSEETGSNLNCTNTGCFFGAPLAVPNSMTIPTSVCVLNTASAPLTGTAVCDTGVTDVDLPLSSNIFLTGDKLGGVDGIQPCPLCTGGDPNTPGSGTCVGGPNNGMACTAGTTVINASYPTSHDCPPDASDSIGSLPVAFRLGSGSIAWTATPATNDVATTASAQTRVFSGFCRDQALPGGEGGFENPAQKCWENGMAVGAPCTDGDSFESCEQRTQGAFGPNGAGNRTIVATGSATSLLSGPAPGTLVSIFSIPPTFDATIDSAGDLPGPGAVAIPGTAALCSSANPCPAP